MAAGEDGVILGMAEGSKDGGNEGEEKDVGGNDDDDASPFTFSSFPSSFPVSAVVVVVVVVVSVFIVVVVVNVIFVFVLVVFFFFFHERLDQR